MEESLGDIADSQRQSSKGIWIGCFQPYGVYFECVTGPIREFKRSSQEISTGE